MVSMTASRVLFCLVLGAGLALSACGRKPSALDTPYDAAVQARKDAEEAGRPLPPEPAAPRPDRPFVLDGLL
jgi:hypothetical protein